MKPKLTTSDIEKELDHFMSNFYISRFFDLDASIKVTPEMIYAIRAEVSDGYEEGMAPALARRFDLSPGTVWLIIKNESHVDPNYNPPAARK